MFYYKKFISNIKCAKEESEKIENGVELFPRSEEKLLRSTSVRITSIARNIESKRRKSY